MVRPLVSHRWRPCIGLFNLPPVGDFFHKRLFTREYPHRDCILWSNWFKAPEAPLISTKMKYDYSAARGPHSTNNTRTRTTNTIAGLGAIAQMSSNCLGRCELHEMFL